MIAMKSTARTAHALGNRLERDEGAEVRFGKTSVSPVTLGLGCIPRSV